MMCHLCNADGIQILIDTLPCITHTRFTVLTYFLFRIFESTYFPCGNFPFRRGAASLRQFEGSEKSIHIHECVSHPHRIHARGSNPAYNMCGNHLAASTKGGRVQQTDARAIALYRVAIATASLVELLSIWPDRHDFLSTFGPGTSGVFLGQAESDALASSTVSFLLCLHAIAALGILCGSERVHECAAIMFLLQAWRCHRNELIESTDMSLLCGASLWAAIMPLEGKRADLVALGARMHLALVYASSFLFKTMARRTDASAPWLAGTAVAESLACCEHQRPLGKWLLLAHPLVCRHLTYLTLALELLAPFGLLLTDGWLRLSLVTALLLFHAALHLCLEIGNFSVTMAALLCIAVPATAFDSLSGVSQMLGLRSLTSSPSAESVHVHRRSLSSASDASDVPAPAPAPAPTLSTSAPPPAPTRKAAARHPPEWAVGVASGVHALLAVCLMCICALGTLEAHLPPTLQPRGEADEARAPHSGGLSGRGLSLGPMGGSSGFVDGLSQWLRPVGEAARIVGLSARYDMFALPPDACGWWAIEARTDRDARPLCAHKLRHRPEEPPFLSGGRPHVPAWQHRSTAWQSFYERISTEYQETLKDSPSASQRRALLAYHCARVQGAIQLKLLFFEERIRVDANGAVSVRRARKHVLADEVCPQQRGNDGGDGDDFKRPGGAKREAMEGKRSGDTAAAPAEDGRHSSYSSHDSPSSQSLPSTLELFHEEMPTSEWRVAPLRYTDESHLITPSGEVVMAVDEQPYMHELARVATASPSASASGSGGGRVLEVGFGMGLSARSLSELGALQHVVCEPNHHVFSAALRHARSVVHATAFSPVLGFWQEVTPMLRDASFDAGTRAVCRQASLTRTLHALPLPGASAVSAALLLPLPPSASLCFSPPLGPVPVLDVCDPQQCSSMPSPRPLTRPSSRRPGGCLGPAACSLSIGASATTSAPLWIAPSAAIGSGWWSSFTRLAGTTRRSRRRRRGPY